MNEERPVREFLKGCTVDIAVLAVMFLLVTGATLLLFMVGAPASPPPHAGEVRVVAAVMAFCVLLAFLFWVRLCVRAFKSERRYYFLGLMSFIPIALLSLGTCRVLPLFLSL